MEKNNIFYKIGIRGQTAISRHAQLSRFEMFDGRPTDKSSEICQQYELRPWETDCKFTRLGWTF